MMIGILITGGDLPEYSLVKDIIKTASIVCAADSGFDWASKNSIKCNYIVGDMDSVENRESLKDQTGKVIEFNVDKDDTDTHIGLNLLKKLGCSEIVLVGGGGGRIDHLLGIFSFFESDLYPNLWFTNREKILLIDKKYILDCKIGCKISVFPIGKVNCSILSNGLKWDLDCVNWDYKSIGISNEVKKENSWIDPGSSKLLLILPITGKSFE